MKSVTGYSMRLTALALALLFLAACPDDAGPAFRSDPSDGEIGVPLDARVSIEIPDDVDLASVEGATVTFVRHDAYGPPLVSFARSFSSETRTLVLAPAQAMKRGLVHEVHVDGLLAGGKPRASLDITFTTLRNPMSGNVNYYLGDWTYTRMEADHDEQGWWTEHRFYIVPFGPGDETLGWRETTVWGFGHSREHTTGEGDGVRQSWTTRYDADGFPTTCETGCLSGESAPCNAGLHHMTSWLRDASGRIATEVHTYIGPDGVWLTADDEWVNPIFYDYADDGTLTREVWAKGPGADGIWRTQDDLVLSGDLYQDEYSERWWPGADGRLGTADDFVEFRIVYARNSDGTLAQAVRFTERGPDATWGTDDDRVGFVDTLAYDGHGALTSVVELEFAGDDGLWGTEDDGVRYRSTYRTDR